MKKLHEQRLKWRPHGKNSSTWAFYNQRNFQLCTMDANVDETSKVFQ